MTEQFEQIILSLISVVFILDKITSLLKILSLAEYVRRPGSHKYFQVEHLPFQALDQLRG